MNEVVLVCGTGST